MAWGVVLAGLVTLCLVDGRKGQGSGQAGRGNFRHGL